MTKLKAAPSRLGSMPPKVRAAPKVADPFYVSPEWRATVRAKKAQGETWCVDCGTGHNLILDHVHERKDGGADLPPLDQLKWRCKPCHNRKTAAARGARARERID